MLLSVIVPVHNAAPYLARMLDSVYAQSLADREVILVDDGSTDASSGIIELFLRRYRFRFIPGLMLRQDVPWTTQVLAFARRVQFFSLPMYNYRVRSRAADARRWSLIAQSYMTVIEALERFNQEQSRLLAPAM